MKKYTRTIKYSDTEEKINLIASKLRIGDYVKFVGQKEISKYLIIGLWVDDIIKEYGLVLVKSNHHENKYLNTIGLTCSQLHVLLNCYFQCLE